MNITEITCNITNNVYTIPLLSFGFTLIFFDTNNESTTLSQTMETFSISTHTKIVDMATVDPAVLAMSNGHSRKNRNVLGSTSKRSSSS